LIKNEREIDFNRDKILGLILDPEEKKKVEKVYAIERGVASDKLIKFHKYYILIHN